MSAWIELERDGVRHETFSDAAGALAALEEDYELVLVTNGASCQIATLAELPAVLAALSLA